MLTVKNAVVPAQLHFRLVMSHAKGAADRAITVGTETTSENAAAVMVLARSISMNMTLIVPLVMERGIGSVRAAKGLEKSPALHVMARVSLNAGFVKELDILMFLWISRAADFSANPKKKLHGSVLLMSFFIAIRMTDSVTSLDVIRISGKQQNVKCTMRRPERPDPTGLSETVKL